MVRNKTYCDYVWWFQLVYRTDQAAQLSQNPHTSPQIFSNIKWAANLYNSLRDVQAVSGLRDLNWPLVSLQKAWHIDTMSWQASHPLTCIKKVLCSVVSIVRHSSLLLNTALSLCVVRTDGYNLLIYVFNFLLHWRCIISKVQQVSAFLQLSASLLADAFVV